MKIYHLVLLIIVLVVGAYIVGSKLNKEIVYRRVEKEVILDNLVGKVNQLKGEPIKEIKMCESGYRDWETVGEMVYLEYVYG